MTSAATALRVNTVVLLSCGLSTIAVYEDTTSDTAATVAEKASSVAFHPYPWPTCAIGAYRCCVTTAAESKRYLDV